MPTEATIPSVSWGEWPIVAIVLFVIFVLGVAFWAVYKDQREWQKIRDDKQIESQHKSNAEMRAWQEQQNLQWQAFLKQQQQPISDVVNALNVLATKVDSGFVRVTERLDAHDSRVEQRVEMASGVAQKRRGLS